MGDTIWRYMESMSDDADDDADANDADCDDMATMFQRGIEPHQKLPKKNRERREGG